jgi:hypothetical protein
MRVTPRPREVRMLYRTWVLVLVLMLASWFICGYWVARLICEAGKP